jgi:hypothetical protein
LGSLESALALAGFFLEVVLVELALPWLDEGLGALDEEAELPENPGGVTVQSIKAILSSFNGLSSKKESKMELPCCPLVCKRTTV